MNTQLMNSAMSLFSLLLVVFGILGMIITLLFMWSTDMREVVSAGLAFIAGSIMLGSGVISLSLNNSAYKEK